MYVTRSSIKPSFSGKLSIFKNIDKLTFYCQSTINSRWEWVELWWFHNRN